MTRLPVPGLHRVPGGAGEAGAAFREAGWRVAPVPVGPTTPELYAGLAAGLDLPSWFGGNLDALWDSLTDLSAPTVLVLTGWPRYAAAEPAAWARLVELLRERAELDPPFAVLLA